MALIKMALAAFRGGKRSIPLTAVCITAASTLISFIFYLSVQLYKFGLFDSNGIDLLIIQTFFITFFIASAVIFAGCAVICSALSVCYNRIIRLLGVFSSCGADGKQITAVLCLEAAIYALISAPAGTVCGTYAAHVMSKFIFPASNGNYIYAFSGGTAVFSFAVAFAAVVISSFVPAVKLSRISVLSALKYQTKINVSLRQSLVSRVLSKLFGYKGKLAGQLYTNEKGKNRTLIFGAVFAESLFMFLYSWLIYDSKKNSLNGGRAMPPHQSEALPYLIGFCVLVLLLCVIAAACSSAAAADAHKSDYTVIRSLGASLSDLTALSLLSSLYLFIYLNLFTVLFTVLANAAMYLIFSFEAMLPLVYPFEVLGIYIVINAAVCVLFALYTVVSIRIVPIISGLKREY
ncbi:MAG: ABC transporter permease, partial [Clostridia bacterium]|nr:ABC transporter permease [Clostridia bacterium]